MCGGGGLLDSSSQTTLLCYDAAAAYVRRQHLMRSFAEVRYACFPWRCRCLRDSVDMLCQIMSHLHVVRGNRVCNTICGATQGAPKEMQHDCAVVCPACSCAYFDANASKCKRTETGCTSSTLNIYCHVVFGVMGWRQGGRCDCSYGDLAHACMCGV